MARRLALVVEDDHDIGEVVRTILARAGLRVIVVTDGQEAFDHIASRERPDVVVLDLMLPSLTGIQLLQQLRQFRAFDDIPFVALTALELPEAERRPFDGYLTKPFEAKALEDMVDGVLARPRVA